MIQVYVLECVDPNEEEELGNQCAERFIAPRAVQENVGISICNVRNSYDIYKLCNDAYFDMKKISKPSPPIVLHIDAHGNENGFKLSDEEACFTWDKLYECCSPLSKISNMQLIVLMGTCKGGYAIKMLRNTDTAPFFCMFGPNKDISTYDLMQFYNCFYNELLTHKRFDIVAKNVIDKFGQLVSFSSAPFWFSFVYKNYILQLSSKKQINRRKELVNMVKKMDLPINVKREKISMLNDIYQTARDHFESHKRKFFMLDEYPENEERFKFITYDAIMSNDKYNIDAKFLSQ